MQLQHAGISNDAVAEQVLTTPEHKKRIVKNDKLTHKSPVAVALERAVVEAARREMKQSS